ncbi:MAG: hypothetical protein ACP5HH_04655 [Fervidicoccaceae archaeon]
MSTTQEVTGTQGVTEEEKLWGFIAWLIPLIGGIIGLVIKQGSNYVRHWSYLSIGFFIVLVIGQVINIVFSFIPFIGRLLVVLVDLGLLVIWIIGILRSLEKNLWKPPIIYDIAKILGL